MAVLPLVMGVAMAYFLHQVYLLAMAGLSPLLLIGSVLSERRYGKKSAAARQSEYAEHKARIKRDAADALKAERLARCEQCPSPDAVLSIAAGPPQPACGSAAAPTRTTCYCGSGRLTCRRRSK